MDVDMGIFRFFSTSDTPVNPACGGRHLQVAGSYLHPKQYRVR